jgi:putative membrane protein
MDPFITYQLTKALHIISFVCWFAGLFYMPRILVNLAMEDNETSYARLLLMARKLYRFMTLLAVPALVFGLWLWLGYGISGGWLHAKLVLVVLLVGYHHACGSLLKKFEQKRNTRSHVWFRWFNEVPVLVLFATLILVVLKPF